MGKKKSSKNTKRSKKSKECKKTCKKESLQLPMKDRKEFIKMCVNMCTIHTTLLSEKEIRDLIKKSVAPIQLEQAIKFFKTLPSNKAIFALAAFCMFTPKPVFDALIIVLVLTLLLVKNGA